jgi:hypothetical protein
MVVQAPLPTRPDPEIEDGVIEEARRRQQRQQRQRRLGSWLIAGVAAAALLAGLAAGGGGSGGGGTSKARPLNGSPGSGAAHASASNEFPGAPVSQPNADGVASGYCRVAAPSLYLPSHSGCVTVRRADVNGDGRRDLIIVYSTLDPKPPPRVPSEPAVSRGYFRATATFLRVVLAGGATLTARITGTPMTHAAAIDAIARVNGLPGPEIFLQVERISSGATDVAYGYQAGHLVSAGVFLGYGGDSADTGGFNCVAGNPPRLIRRDYQLIGPTIYGWWKERVAVLTWHGARLVQLSTGTLRHHGLPTRADSQIGPGCIHGVG